MPTVWVGWLQGRGDMQRVYGPDYMIAMCQRSLHARLPALSLRRSAGSCRKTEGATGSSDAVAADCGYLHSALWAAEPESRRASSPPQWLKHKPDIFWVGLSTPKQERFMSQYLDRLDVKLMAGVGAAFDLHAGLRGDAPDWMKRCGLQWLHRLSQEPRRLGPTVLET